MEKAIGLILLPLYTRFFSPSEYGVIALIEVTSVILILLLELGTKPAVNRFYYDSDLKEDHRLVIGSGILFLFITTSISISILFVFSRNISGILLGNEVVYLICFRLALASVFIKVIAVIPYVILRIQQKSVQYSILNILSLILNIALTILFVVILKAGLVGIFKAALISTVLVTLALVPLTLKNVTFRMPIALVSKMLQFGLPFIPHYLMSYLLFSADRFFLKYISGETELGLYSAGYKIAMIMSMVVNAFSTAWTPYMYSIALESDAKDKFRRIMTYYLVITVFIAVSLSVFAREILMILTQKTYWAAAGVIPLIIGSYLFQGMYSMCAGSTAIVKKTQYLLLFSFLALAVNTILNILLIPRFGMMGAAYATIAAYFALFLSAYIITQRLYPIKYEYRRIAKIVATGLGILFISNFAKTDNMLTAIIYKVFLMASFPILLYAFGFYHKGELGLIVKALYRHEYSRN